MRLIATNHSKHEDHNTNGTQLRYETACYPAALCWNETIVCLCNLNLKYGSPRALAATDVSLLGDKRLQFGGWRTPSL